VTSLNAIFFTTQNFPSSPQSTFIFNNDLQFIQIYCLAYENCSFIHKVPSLEMEQKRTTQKSSWNSSNR